MSKSIPSGSDVTLEKTVSSVFSFLVGQKDFTGLLEETVEDILQNSTSMYTKHVCFMVSVFMRYVLTQLEMLGGVKDVNESLEWITNNHTAPVSSLYNSIKTSLETGNGSTWDACVKDFMLGIIKIKYPSSSVKTDTAFVSEDPLYQQTTAAPIATGATAKSKLKKVHAKLLS
jgi:hypothetical protein